MSIDSIQDKISREWKNDDDTDFDLQTMKQEGSLTLHTFQGSYSQDGKFDLQNALTQLRKKMRRSSEHERKGFPYVGDMNPFFDIG